ncbi:HNH endonuclease [Halotia branconii]
MFRSDEYKNLQLLHKHCHDAKTTKDGLVGGGNCQPPKSPKSRMR